MSIMKPFRYLALGDSYTIGEAVPESGSFPAQLVRRLEENTGRKNDQLQIIATTGWTTDELLSGISEAKPSDDFDLVSLLIGVNNQYRGYPRNQYSEEFRKLLQLAITFAGGDPERVFVVAIPDYGCTPYGTEKAAVIDEELRWYNAEARQIAAEYQIPFSDIYAVSKEAAANPALTASDNLHPSAEMYARWVEVIFPIAKERLSQTS